MSNALTLTQRDLILAGPLGSLEAYAQAVSQVPVLSVEEEQALAIRLRDHQDLDAARQLVLAHLRFVMHVARGYQGYGLPLGDLVQEGNVGLMKAVKRFDPTVGVRLVSFAVHWIRAEIHEYIIKNWRIVKVATTKAQRKLFFNLRRHKTHLGWLTHAEAEAVARDLGVTPAEVVEMEQRLAGHDFAFDLSPTEEDDEHAFAPAAYLSDEGSDPARQLEAEDWESQAVDALSTALQGLDARSRDIVQRRWLDADKATLQDLADRYGVSAERIRQLESNALKKLKGVLVA